jgi:hypothetical protein
VKLYWSFGPNKETSIYIGPNKETPILEAEVRGFRFRINFTIDPVGNATRM